MEMENCDFFKIGPMGGAWGVCLERGGTDVICSGLRVEGVEAHATI